jgi:hypothetical protein
MRLDWRGLAAVLIVVGVFAVLIIGSIGAILNRGREVTTEDIATISAVLGTAIGAVSVYLGTKTNGKPPADTKSKPPDDGLRRYGGKGRNRPRDAPR